MTSEAIRPCIAVVMGVSGAGKTTVANLLAAHLGWEMLEGDDLHPPENIAKMASGHPLTDADRKPWLESIARWISARVEAGGSAVVTCSALKRSYRDVLRQAVAGHPEATLIFVYLHGSPEELHRRLVERKHHYMHASMLDSQLATLEQPTGEPDAVTIDIGGTPREVVAAAAAAVETRRDG
ncbi:gluconokinase [Nocardia goodfellowii]|uniref:Gluconokinase n=1 Tax=Nocardia goodfellowii TaxID=882446 RepID=A0ABS4QRN9_9NOCA|nr:gluconokinase [Nocardia goodfellowii]MBP2194342.1 gluconokinase [Nocardia goodfellowii]